MKEYFIAILCLIAGLGYGLAFYFAPEMSESRAEKRRAIAELTEVRIMAEWDRFEEGRGNYE
jgi:hypothetical protein